MPRTHLCTDMPTWLLWAGAGQKAKHKLSSACFLGHLTRIASPVLSCTALERMLTFWNGRTIPGKGVVPFAGLVCDTAAAMS